jgi:hypothetical protein
VCPFSFIDRRSASGFTLAVHLDLIYNLGNVRHVGCYLFSLLTLLWTLNLSLQREHSIVGLEMNALLVQSFGNQQRLVVLFDSIVDVGFNLLGLGFESHRLNADFVGDHPASGGRLRYFTGLLFGVLRMQLAV